MNTVIAPASTKQIAFIKTLVAERDLTLVWEPGMDPEGPEARSTAALTAVETARDLIRQKAPFTVKAASLLISYLLKAPRAEQPSEDLPTKATEGMYIMDGDIFKVVKGQTGRLYAKRLIPQGYKSATWVYAPAVVAKLRDSMRMCAEDAAKYGALYGVCCNCARTLTDETSIALGYGPVCAAHNGWPYRKVA